MLPFIGLPLQDKYCSNIIPNKNKSENGKVQHRYGEISCNSKDASKYAEVCVTKVFT